MRSITEAPDDLAVHTDTLLKQAAIFCAHGDAGVRKGALTFLLVCATAIPFPRLYAWRETILAGVAVALDDPKRDIRRLSVVCSNKYHNLE